MADDRTRAELVENLSAGLAEHLRTLGMATLGKDDPLRELPKEVVRARHLAQRRDVLAQERAALTPYFSKILPYFAEGWEIDPARIRPQLVPVDSDSTTSLLFRVAALLWSVPVSRGYGRRMRYLVLDQSNGRLIGIFALGDPVFNLKMRDDWIGWTVRDREARLVNVMDAYVAGAVPPYSELLGGKLVVSLIGSSAVSVHFEEKYAGSRGIISGEVKSPKLALVTVTSALGRSSLYNRLRLPGLLELQRIGKTQGWGHFQIPDEQFESMRELLALDEHRYATAHRYGDGPNWRMRVIREALKRMGMDENLLRHGIAREVFGMPLAQNWREFLRGIDATCIVNRPSAECITEAALERWVMPRAVRRPDFRRWTRWDTFQRLGVPPG